MAKARKKPVGTRKGRNGGRLNSGGDYGGHRPPGKTPKGLIRELYAQGKGEGLQAILDAQYQRATIQQDTAAAKLILETGWGKPTQPLTGEDGGAVEIKVVFPD